MSTKMNKRVSFKEEDLATYADPPSFPEPDLEEGSRPRSRSSSPSPPPHGSNPILQTLLEVRNARIVQENLDEANYNCTTLEREAIKNGMLDFILFTTSRDSVFRQHVSTMMLANMDIQIGTYDGPERAHASWGRCIELFPGNAYESRETAMSSLDGDSDDSTICPSDTESVATVILVEDEGGEGEEVAGDQEAPGDAPEDAPKMALETLPEAVPVAEEA